MHHAILPGYDTSKSTNTVEGVPLSPPFSSPATLERCRRRSQLRTIYTSHCIFTKQSKTYDNRGMLGLSNYNMSNISLLVHFKTLVQLPGTLIVVKRRRTAKTALLRGRKSLLFLSPFFCSSQDKGKRERGSVP